MNPKQSKSQPRQLKERVVVGSSARLCENSDLVILENEKRFKSLSTKIKMRQKANESGAFFAALARGEFSHRLARC